jgi:3',5'-cyclic AMP phosphodiesterase CpdA
MIRLAHLSDLHATQVPWLGPADFAGKRLLGWLSWRARRRKIHRVEVLEALLRDLPATAADHIVVAGDLTNLACEHEFDQARAWLERLGPPGRVSIVPGNHDAYVAMPRGRSWDRWSAYLDSDEGAAPGGFPTLRVRGSLALVGVCSAVPSAPLLATGRLGEEQLEQLDKLLAGLAESPLCRVLLIHHPITDGATSRRRALTDAAALRGVLARRGVDLVLHGHGHRTLFGGIPGPHGPIPVVGVRSSSDIGHKPHKRAQYHLYEIEPRASVGGGGARFRITTRIRGYDPVGDCFSGEGERVL